MTFIVHDVLLRCYSTISILAFKQRIEGVGKIKDGHNPAAWMLEITTPTREMDLNVDFADIYKNSELYR